MGLQPQKGANPMPDSVNRHEYDRGWERERQEGALANSDLAEEITTGRWAGFTRGEAIAWNWNLFDYEPQGFIAPASQLRMESIRKLKNGDIPEVFGYPERARELADQGITPLQYRESQKAQGKTVFSPSAVTFHRAVTLGRTPRYRRRN